MVEVMDEGIGRIMGSLREEGLEEQTLVIFCSDNGGVPELGDNGPLNGHKGTVWEGGHRVPAIACWKGRITPATIDQTVMGMDLFPTIRSLAGITGPAGPDPDGTDLSGLLLAGEKLPERHLVWRYRNQKAVRRGPYKLLVFPSDTLLFHLGEDPGETRDLSADLPGTADSLQAYLKNWEREMDRDYVQKTR
jgi:arylsulfatase A-like enzyme